MQELEQSEYERQEKEQERISAHESIVEREIRLQREKEVELARQRGVPPPPAEHSATVTAAAPPPTAHHHQHHHHAHTPSDLSLSSTEPASPHVLTSLSNMSDSRDTLSPDSGVASMDTKLVTYEEAISGYNHRGENLIAKELREQKEREEELRKRWNEQGVQSPLAELVPDTPYNMPEPQQPKPIPGHPNMVSTSKAQVSLTNGTSSHYSNGPAAKSPGGFYQQGIKSYMEPQLNAARRGSVESDDRSQSSSEGATGKGTRGFAGASDEQDGESYAYVPREETPIDREIRLAREREEELRAQKGLSPRGVTPDGGDRLMEMKVDVPHRPHNLERGKMSHFSSGRLQYEIEKEKQRERSMQQEGRVLTLSEERAETKKYMDVIDKDSMSAPAPTPPKTPASAGPRQGAYMRGAGVPIYTNPTFYTTPPTGRTGMGDKKLSAPESIAAASAPVENGAAEQPRAHDAEPSAAKPVVRSVSHQSKLASNSVNSAELKIEAELREMREREEELR